MRKMVESINPVTIRDCLLVEFPTDQPKRIKGRVAPGSLTVRTEKILDFIKFLIFGFSGQNASTGVPAEFEVIVESKKFMTAMKHLFATDPVWVQFLSGFQFGSGKTGGV